MGEQTDKRRGLRVIEAKVPAEHVAALDALCEREGCSRTAAICAIVRGLACGELELTGVRVSKRERLILAGRRMRQDRESRGAAG